MSLVKFCCLMMKFNIWEKPHPESTEHLIDEKLDFVFSELTSHLGQVSKHVRHHQVTEENTERDGVCVSEDHTFLML